MPELPEVETIVRDLRAHLEGQLIESCELLFPTMVRHPEPALFAAELKGRTIEKVSRRGKYIWIHLDGGDMLVVHLGMSGRVLLSAPELARPNHTHAVFLLGDGKELRYSDPRRFGRLLLGTERELVEAGKMPTLGPEPLAADFRVADLRRSLSGRRAPVKALLLDQRVVAGIGNIYVDESCFRARVRPDRAAGSLSRASVERLHEALGYCLRLGIANRGSSIADYVDAWGAKGSQQESLQVYGRAGQPCFECGRPLARIVLSSRTTVFCSR
ncbi:MAG TPA: bifunctional DNA-formamidopyrimidine glycosylase/DNA-(apurinic or apyrimidinic site) lyase, partial [Candidatus Dormibacteraeota bacterium]|nr:bifunctional DNA-formamidopyrimidine glycosylase/DNA-(apurinic or apyrimidinic site) lyase [Candidatus Dormibacteraeota bacterium]